MVPALHQNLDAAHGGKLIEFLIYLLKREHIMVVVFFGSIKSAELAVNVADIRVVDVAIDDVSHDLAALSLVSVRFGKLASRIGQPTELFQLPAIKLERLLGRNARARQNLLRERVAIQ